MDGRWCATCRKVLRKSNSWPVAGRGTFQRWPCPRCAAFRDQVEQYFQNGGDKHRLTLINISRIENWFNPEESVQCVKDFHVLLVFCQHHVMPAEEKGPTTQKKSGKKGNALLDAKQYDAVFLCAWMYSIVFFFLTTCTEKKEILSEYPPTHTHVDAKTLPV